MRQLCVQNFSCIKDATLSLGRLTVIVGPQASGKSILCKLAYFFIDVLDDQWESINNGDSFKGYEAAIKHRFLKWFPVQAWGAKKFTITFLAGELKISITRKIYAGNVGDDIRIKCSNNIADQYALVAAQVAKLKKPGQEKLELGWERDWEIRKLSNSSISNLAGEDAVLRQIFVPAGRSFFTSVGKAVTAFDHSGLLDPLTVQFGRIFAAYRDHGGHYLDSRDKRVAHFLELLEGILGGKLVSSREAEYIQTTDGRKVPLSSLSSGQQELLPLVSILPYILSGDNRKVAYIEEPEAHLFPSAQSKIVEVFAQIINESAKTDLVITTHSPYVLVKINNLIKAGQIGRMHGEKSKRAIDVVPRKSWISPKNIRAYAIVDGVLKEIVDSNGFIDGDYLDDVSGQLEVEFNRLMGIQHES
jgi:energy-coupling factor transporter ATP-binding protein EcfA2